jgi:hypothetical protein
MTTSITSLVRVVRLVIAMSLVAVAPLAAQGQPIPIVPELRVDVLGRPRASAQGAFGVNIPAGPYVRVGVLAGVGGRLDSPSGVAGRVDVLARFLLDPFRQSRWGLSAGGGVSLRADEGDRVRPNLLVALDLEGPRTRSGVSPAFQVGFGGGVRGGVGLRWSGRTAR